MDTVVLGRLMALVDVANRHQVDTGSPPIELVVYLEIDPELLDFGGATPLIVGIESDAAMLEFDFGVEDDVWRDRVSWQQHEPMDVKAILPFAACVGIFERAEFDLPIGTKTETWNGRVGQSQKPVVRGCGRCR